MPCIDPSDETIAFGPLTLRFLITGADSNDSVALFELGVRAGGRLPAPPHSHDHYEETMYGIEGQLTVTVDGERFDIGPGQSICIPRGSVHRFDNDGEKDAKVLCVVSPANIGPEYFREVFEVFSAGGPPDKEKMAEIMLRYGLKPALP